MSKTAVIFGSTGLIGNELLRQIVDDAHFESIRVFARKKFRLKNLHAEVISIDFENLSESAHLITGDDCFCCLGTTMKKAGSKENFRKVDFDLVLQIAKLASQNRMKRFIVVSSIGADASSSNFYLRTKGEMEEAVQKLPFEQIIIARPSVLTGNRREFRPAERIGILFATILSPFMIGPLKKYKPINVKRVAKALLYLSATKKKEKIIYESNELYKLGRGRLSVEYSMGLSLIGETWKPAVK